MAEVQTTYTRYMPVAQVGMPATMSGWDIDTKICETSAGLVAGVAVSQGSADRGVTLGGGAGFVGITVRDVTLLLGLTHTTADKYALGDNTGVMVRGDIWVVCVAGCVAGDPVTFDAATGALSNTGGVTIVAARWMTSAAAGGLAIARLNSSTGQKV